MDYLEFKIQILSTDKVVLVIDKVQDVTMGT